MFGGAKNSSSSARLKDYPTKQPWVLEGAVPIGFLPRDIQLPSKNQNRIPVAHYERVFLQKFLQI
jgi:hypothetical protein